jgi:uncharacterized protein YuzE
MGIAEIKDIDMLLPYFIRHQNIWTDYDAEVDTLYVHYKKPNQADRSEITDDDVIVRYQNDEIVGLTIMNASKRYQGDFSSLVSEPDALYQSSNIAPVNEYLFSKLLFDETVKVYKIRGAQVLLYEGNDLGRCIVNAQGKIIHHEKSTVNSNINFAVVEDEFKHDAEKYLRG